MTFGEIALLKRRPRGATITAMEDSHFALLEQLDFDRILSNKVKRGNELICFR